MNDDQSRPSDPTPLGGEDLDPATLAALQSALGELDFLRPDAPLDEAPMPEWAIQRVTSALHDERGTTAAPRRWNRWAGGLVAASVAVLAVGVVVTTFSGSGGSDIVLSEATATPTAAVAEAEPAEQSSVLALPAPPESDALAAAPVDETVGDISIPGMLSFAGMVPPAATVLGSKTDYNSPQLERQVADVLDDMAPVIDTSTSRMKPLPDAMAKKEIPLIPDAAVQQASRTLRDCVTRLTKVASSTALLVDWSRVDGQDAGVIVVPEYGDDESAAPNTRELDIWVIDPECDVRMTVHMSMP